MSTKLLFHLFQVLAHFVKSFTFTVDRHDFLTPEYVAYLKISHVPDANIYYRDVKVPAEDVKKCKDFDDMLEKVFYWGQNDFQEVDHSPSVSVKDVILVTNKKFRVESRGFKEVK